MAVVVRLDWSEIVLYIVCGLSLVCVVGFWANIQTQSPPAGIGGSMPYGGLVLDRNSLTVVNHPSFDATSTVRQLEHIIDSIGVIAKDEAIMFANEPQVGTCGGFQVVCNFFWSCWVVVCWSVTLAAAVFVWGWWHQ